MKIKKLLALSLASIMALGVLTGCGGNQDAQGGSSAEGGSGDVVEISFPTHWVGVSVTTEWFQDRLAAFNEQYGDQIKVNVEEIAGDQNYVDKMKVLYSSDSLPDVINTGGYNLIDSMKDQLVDLTPYVDDELRTHGTDLCWETNSRDGKIYGIPFTRQVIGYFYNKDLFAQAGIEKPAETWDEFFEQCDKLLAAGITPLAMDTADGAWVSMLLMGAMIATSGDEGAEFMNTKYPTDYNIAPVVDAIGHMQEWYQKYTTLDAVGGAYENAANNFFSGNVAMICNGPWMIGDFSDTSKTPEGFDQNVGVATYPGGFVYDAPIEGMFVTKQDDPALEEAAIAMVKFFTSAESQQLALEMQGMVPAAASVEITDTATTNFPLLGEFLNMASECTVRSNTFTGNMVPGLQDLFSAELPNLANGTYTPEQFCQILTDFATENAVA